MIIIKNYRKKILVILSILVLSLLLGACEPDNNASIDFKEGDGLKVHFIDIGQGDSSLIEFPNGEKALIDGGPRSSSDKLIKYLRNAKIETIDYLIATHPHEDHIGGLPKVLENFKVKNVYMPEKTANTKIFESLLKEIDRQGLKIQLGKTGDTLIDKDGLIFKFLAPVRTDYDNTNDFSIVSRIDYGNNSLIIMGDAEAKSEKDIIATGEKLQADVLRVGHHGSSTSSTREFLDRVDARDYVISLGKDNSYGHPHRETMDSIGIKKGNIYRTDEMGDIIMLSDGNKISFDKAPELVKEIEEVLIGNKNTKIYHVDSCSYLPKESNRIRFNSRQEAIKNGFKAHSCVK